MIHPDPTRRPSTFDLIRHPVLLTASRMNADQLRVELNAERFKNALLQKYVIYSFNFKSLFQLFEFVLNACISRAKKYKDIWGLAF